MDSHLSNVVKFSLSWGILLLGLCYWMSIPLKFWLKYTPCNVEETYKKNPYFIVNSVWPRYRLSDQ